MDDLQFYILFNTSFSTVFQSYKQDRQVIMKGYVPSFTVEKILPQVGQDLRTSGSVGQHLTH